MTKIAYISDLHLDTVQWSSELNERINVINSIEADYLVIAGDICEMQYLEYFFGLLKPNVKKIIVVRGNHEYYNTDISDLGIYPEHVICLDENTSFSDGEVTFVGCTLWSNIPQNKQPTVERCMNDYHLIKSNGVAITALDTSCLHMEHLQYLKDKIHKLQNSKTKKVVVTHHSPSYKGVNEKFFGHFLNSAFHTDVLQHFKDDDISVWIHGHTHDSIDYVEFGINVICNPYGYKNENSNVQVRYIDI